MTPNLVSVAFVREALRVWRELPLARRIWRRIRWRVVAIVVPVTVLWNVLLPLGLNAMIVAGRSWHLLMYPVQLASAAIPVLLMLWYLRWVYRTQHAENTDQRILPLSPLERFLSLLLPGIAGCALHLALASLGIPLITFVAKLAVWQFGRMVPSFPARTPPDLVSIAHLSLSAMYSSFSFVAWSILFCLLGRRYMLLDSVTGHCHGRSKWFVGRLIGAWVLTYLMTSLACLPVETMLRRSFGTNDVMSRIGTYFVMALVQSCPVTAALLCLARWFWNRDEPLAQEFLFAEGGGEDAEPSANPMP